MDSGEVHELYANVFKVGYNAAEVLVDFGRGFEDTEARFLLRVITTPPDAKRLLEVLAKSIHDYEEEFGVIYDPTDR